MAGTSRVDEEGGDGRPARPYRMDERARAVDRTRQRIVEAAVDLHGEVGPLAATITEIADRAGVTRVTVYRHFPDQEALFAACSAHWESQQRQPDPAAWAAIADPAERLRVGLADLYRFYAAGEQMLTGVERDRAGLPPGLRARLDEQDRALRDALAGEPASSRRLALVGHAAAFSTWRSLCVEQGLDASSAVAAMAAMVTAAG